VSNLLVERWDPAQAPAPVAALGVSDYFGAIYEAQRVFSVAAPLVLDHDDALRVWVDGSPVYDSWDAPQSVDNATTAAVAPGSHDIEAHYIERTGGAFVEVTW
jgi:hypothetical protein